MSDRVDPLNRPVRVPCGDIRYGGARNLRDVALSDALVAADDEQRQAMVERIVWALADAQNNIPGSPHYRQARAVVAALCEGARDE